MLVPAPGDEAPAFATQTLLTSSHPVAAQSDGTDLDPHNLKWQPRGEGGGRGGAPAAVAAVEEGAPCRGLWVPLPILPWHSCRPLMLGLIVLHYIVMLLYFPSKRIMLALRDVHATISAMYE